MANLFDPEFDQDQTRDGFRNRRAMLGKQVGSERLGASLFELQPGQAAFPLHYHLANEEMLIVVAGTPTLLTGQRERELAEGEIVSFPVGPGGAHQVVNRTDRPVRILMLSEMIAPDIVVRPESGKISAFGRPPGGHGEGMHGVYFERDSVPFWEGEEPPP
ncbi:MAG TPA: cupin domain-containing protein [Solirubrobacterales bacterium]|jgi:uncharacterized cupin superfamily protein|nr:cupin domain-containing protein [Solirubrobacterales bacterium]